MWKFDARRMRSVFGSVFGRVFRSALESAPPAEEPSRTEPSRAELQLRAIRNIRLIAVLGLLLIFADLLLSLTGQDVQILRENGSYYLLRPSAGESSGHVSLRASVKTEEDVVTRSFDVRLDPQQDSDGNGASDGASDGAGNGSSDGAGDGSSGGAGGGATSRKAHTEELISSELRSVAAGFNDDLSSRKVPLPAAVSTGEPIRWSIKKSSHVLLLALMTVMLSAVVYRGRFQPLRKMELRRQRSVQKQLPVFVNELVLLMGAGLVLSRAFEAAVESAGGEASGKTSGETSDYFYSGLRRICHSIRNTNAVMHEELRSFSKESGVSEFMRVSSIISDNINKGSELTEKLERETDSLWNARRLHAEQRGRLAETKMTIPLAVFLCVLIIITVAPAMMQL